MCCSAQQRAAARRPLLPPLSPADYWATRPVTVLKRWIRIGAALAGWYMDGRWHKGSSVQGLSDLRAESLLRMLTNLGPAFIKIGQAVSSRWAEAALIDPVLIGPVRNRKAVCV